MDFKAEKKTIEGLFSSKKQFLIPRFQREYSWGPQELKTFYEDIIGRLRYIDNENSLETSEYFIGSILLVGDMNDQRTREIQVIDGQQRLTTITIFLSALYQSFLVAKELDLANKLWEYIMSQDNDLKEYAILNNETPKPFFQFLIQTKKDYKEKPKNTEEENILKAYNYFLNQLKFNNIKKTILKLLNKNIDNFLYCNLIKIIRDQLLRCVVVCIWTPDIKYANMIFEILNAKGKTLASIDLIKNSIFEILNKEQPADEAKEKWKQIRNNLTSRNLMIDFSTFFRHFWVGTQTKCVEKKLYPSFLSRVPKNEESYLNFLNELVKYSEIYAKILKLDITSDFNSQKQYNTIIKSCNALNEMFGIVQVRSILVNLYILHTEKKLIKFNQYKNFVEFLEIFHLCYNVLCSKRTSKIEKTYSDLGIKLYNATTSEQCISTINYFKNIFRSFIPQKNEILEEMSKLKYSKQKTPTNLVSKYILRKIEENLCGYSIDESIFSIEHIYDESSQEETLELGNLLLLETPINNSIAHGVSLNDKKNYYIKSKYKIVEMFLKEHQDIEQFKTLNIQKRTEQICNFFYTNIIEKALK